MLRLLYTAIPFYLALINLTAFILYGVDKSRAVHHKWRIRERVLLLTAFLGGGAGALCGMLVFRHKTQKLKFKILVPAALILWLVFYA